MVTPVDFHITLKDETQSFKVSVPVSHESEAQLNQTVNQLLFQMSDVGATHVSSTNGKVRHYPGHRIKYIDVEVNRVVIANKVPQKPGVVLG